MTDQTKRLAKSHLCSYYYYLIEIVSAACKDLESDLVNHAPVTIHAWLKRMALLHVDLNKVDGLLIEFRDTCTWNPELIGEIEAISSSFGHLKKRISKLGLVTYSGDEPTVIVTRPLPSDFSQIYLGPDRSISFGHFSVFFQILRAKFLFGKRSTINFLDVDESSSAFPEFSRIFKYCGINRIDLTCDRISLETLIAYHDGGGSDEVCDSWNKRLFDKFGISSFGYQVGTENGFDSSTNIDLLRKSSRVVLGRLATNVNAQDLLESIASLKSRTKGIVILANRDALYTGAGQPWRDSPISSYSLVVCNLISDGWGVVRINNIADPLPFLHNNCIDIANKSVTPALQIEILRLAEFCIGCSTGITEYATQLCFMDTLYIDSAVAYNTGHLGCSWHAPKKLVIVDETRLRRHKRSDLYHFIFKGYWTNYHCAEFGLATSALLPEEIFTVVKDFVANRSSRFICSLELNQDSYQTMTEYSYVHHYFYNCASCILDACDS